MTEKKSKSNDGIFPTNLSRYLSLAGVASRRKCADIIKSGQVKVNGKTVIQPGEKITENDRVSYDGKIQKIGKRHYIVLNKPRGYVCTSEDKNAPKKAIDLINIPDARIFSAGRLDKDSEGLIIFTNDGDYAEKLAHPKYETTKLYRVKIDKGISDKTLKELCAGIYDDGEFLKPEKIEREKDTVFLFEMREGKKREIRRMIKYAKRKTVRLQRIAIGGLCIGTLSPGKWRFLNQEEIALSLQGKRTTSS
jgi:23S rRNA pseudouridine2605 synthase